uniref:RING-CH-type domain-containing protein n=1 Tax=Zea mays TaxID=4577 RepID=A0A804NHY6_MAIZE
MLERHRVHRDADGDLPAAVTAPLLAHPPSPAEPWPANFGSSEITDEEIDAASAACCRICLESESEPGDVLISPCMCKGTQQFVHRSCLDHWRKELPFHTAQHARRDSIYGLNFWRMTFVVE